MHCPELQRCPIGQEEPVPQRQVPVTEQLSAPTPQLTQARPLVPQDVPVGGLTQVVPWQQPDGQFELSQNATQLVPSQRCPSPQAGLAPHWHAPLEEQ